MATRNNARSRTKTSKTRRGRIEQLHAWLRSTVDSLTKTGVNRVSFVSIPGAQEEHVFLMARGSMFTLDMTPAEWDAWGSEAVRSWWELSALPITASIGDTDIQPSLLRLSNYALFDDEAGLVKVYQKGGPPEVHYGDASGLDVSEPISPLSGGEAYVHGADSSYERAWVRHELEDKRSLGFDRTKFNVDSRTRFGRLLLDEIKLGVHKDLINGFAANLRTILPALKAGAPLLSDVKSKLDMEAKLRRDEQVTGSLRPLALTLEALQGTDTTDLDYPGLWMLSMDEEQEVDVRSHFAQLLLWDSALHVIASAVRFHGEFKSGIVFGKEPSRCVFVVERRFSKRDTGEVESIYVQINPARITGNMDGVTSRIMTHATHELAHAGTYSNLRHPEIFVARREAFLNAAADHVAEVRKLVTFSGLVTDRFRPTADRPYSIEQFVLDEVRSRPMTLVGFLTQRWAAFRNISENKAAEEILQEIAVQEGKSRIERVSPDVIKLI